MTRNGWILLGLLGVPTFSLVAFLAAPQFFLGLGMLAAFGFMVYAIGAAVTSLIVHHDVWRPDE